MAPWCPAPGGPAGLPEAWSNPGGRSPPRTARTLMAGFRTSTEWKILTFRLFSLGRAGEVGQRQPAQEHAAQWTDEAGEGQRSPADGAPQPPSGEQHGGLDQ